MKVELDHVLLAGVAVGVTWLWYDSSLRVDGRVATRGAVMLRSAVPYRFTYQTTFPIASAAPSVATTARQDAIRLLLVPASAYGIEFSHKPGLIGGEYLVSFTSAPPHDVQATIGTPLVASDPASAFDLKLARVERMDGQKL